MDFNITTYSQFFGLFQPYEDPRDIPGWIISTYGRQPYAGDTVYIHAPLELRLDEVTGSDYWRLTDYFGGDGATVPLNFVGVPSGDEYPVILPHPGYNPYEGNYRPRFLINTTWTNFWFYNDSGIIFVRNTEDTLIIGENTTHTFTNCLFTSSTFYNGDPSDDRNWYMFSVRNDVTLNFNHCTVSRFRGFLASYVQTVGYVSTYSDPTTTTVKYENSIFTEMIGISHGFCHDPSSGNNLFWHIRYTVPGLGYWKYAALDFDAWKLDPLLDENYFPAMNSPAIDASKSPSWQDDLGAYPNCYDIWPDELGSRHYYISTSGSDDNPGHDPSSPMLTWPSHTRDYEPPYYDIDPGFSYADRVNMGDGATIHVYGSGETFTINDVIAFDSDGLTVIVEDLDNSKRYPILYTSSAKAITIAQDCTISNLEFYFYSFSIDENVAAEFENVLFCYNAASTNHTTIGSGATVSVNFCTYTTGATYLFGGAGTISKLCNSILYGCTYVRNPSSTPSISSVGYNTHLLASAPQYMGPYWSVEANVDTTYSSTEEDPLFNSDTDRRLRSDSPCIDAADPAEDDGSQNGVHYDKGAYEYWGYSFPVCDFHVDGDDTGIFPITFDLIDDSTAEAGHPITSWYWKLGVQTSALEDPSFLIETAGDWNVSLTVTNDVGSVKVTKSAYLHTLFGDSPVADFSATPLSGSSPLSVVFTNLTVDAYPPTTWDWDFGDLTPHSTDENPTHTYTADGVYTVTLTATNLYYSDAEIKTSYVVVGYAPVANFVADTVSFVSAPATVSFTNLSTNNPTYYQWNFGDSGSYYYEENPSHTYNIDGQYTVVLIAGNYHGSDSETKVLYISIGSAPVADFSADVTSGETILEVNFTDLSTNTPTSWDWDFGDGSAHSTDQNPTHVYSEPGTYTVTLIATNFRGSDSEEKVAYITTVEGEQDYRYVRQTGDDSNDGMSNEDGGPSNGYHGAWATVRHAIESVSPKTKIYIVNVDGTHYVIYPAGPFGSIYIKSCGLSSDDGEITQHEIEIEGIADEDGNFPVLERYVGAGSFTMFYICAPYCSISNVEFLGAGGTNIMTVDMELGSGTLNLDYCVFSQKAEPSWSGSSISIMGLLALGEGTISVEHCTFSSFNPLYPDLYAGVAVVTYSTDVYVTCNNNLFYFVGQSYMQYQIRPYGPCIGTVIVNDYDCHWGSTGIYIYGNGVNTQNDPARIGTHSIWDDSIAMAGTNPKVCMRENYCHDPNTLDFHLCFGSPISNTASDGLWMGAYPEACDCSLALNCNEEAAVNTPPFVEDEDPAPGETDVSRSSHIIFEVLDDESNVDLSTLNVYVNHKDGAGFVAIVLNGVDQHYQGGSVSMEAMTQGASKGYLVNYTPGRPLGMLWEAPS